MEEEREENWFKGFEVEKRNWFEGLEGVNDREEGTANVEEIGVEQETGS